jgi:NAD+ kinase
MRVAIYARSTSDNTSEAIAELFTLLKARNVSVLVFEPFHAFVRERFSLDGSVGTFADHTQLAGKVDCVLSLGGDGTFLEALTYVRNSGIPILGINTGRLGFLANVAKTEIAHAVDELVDQRYTIEKRALLSVIKPEGLFADVNYGLNELTLLKKDSSSMITIHTYINGDFLNSYFADGLIISTPTGSTAYSLSCGGPLVMPGSQNFIITPIAPHNLNVRPLVISDNNIITLKVEGRSPNYLVSLDSRSAVIDDGTELTLKKADFYAHLIKLEDQSFFNTMRNKLLWGLDKRN